MFNSSYCKPLSADDKFQVVLNGKTREEIWDHYGLLATTLSSSLAAAIDNLTPFTTTDRKVLKCLAVHQGRNVDTFASINLIAIETRLCRRSVEESLKHLTELEVLTSYKRDPQSKIIYRRIDIDAILSVYEEQIHKRLKHPASATNVAYPMTSKDCKNAKQQSANQERSTVIFGGPGQMPNATQCAENFGDTTAENCTHVSEKNCGPSRTRNDRYNNIYTNLNQSVINQPIGNQDTRQCIYPSPYPQREAEGQIRFADASQNNGYIVGAGKDSIETRTAQAPQTTRRQQRQRLAPPNTKDEVYNYMRGAGFDVSYTQAANWFHEKQNDGWMLDGEAIKDWHRMALAYCRHYLKLEEHSSILTQKATELEEQQELERQQRQEEENIRKYGVPKVPWLWTLSDDERQKMFEAARQDAITHGIPYNTAGGVAANG